MVPNGLFDTEEPACSGHDPDGRGRDRVTQSPDFLPPYNDRGGCGQVTLWESTGMATGGESAGQARLEDGYASRQTLRRRNFYY